MRIIKEGKIPEKEYRVICQDCKTEFAFYWNDTKYDIGLVSINIWNRYVNCPLCKKSLLIEL